MRTRDEWSEVRSTSALALSPSISDKQRSIGRRIALERPVDLADELVHHAVDTIDTRVTLLTRDDQEEFGAQPLEILLRL